MKRPLAYITAPWSENEFENTENAASIAGRSMTRLFARLPHAVSAAVPTR